jgi:hypothetical protein
MQPYGVARSWDEYPVFKNPTRRSARKHTAIKKMLHRRERRVTKYRVKIGDLTER